MTASNSSLWHFSRQIKLTRTVNVSAMLRQDMHAQPYLTLKASKTR
jgi:hypothetical protein